LTYNASARNNRMAFNLTFKKTQRAAPHIGGCEY